MNMKKRGVFGILIRNPKSQAAIFIIVSLIVILSGVLYFFYQRQAVEKEVEIIQPEAAPIKLYVENCIKSVAEDGLERIGLSGGYITVPDGISSNPKSHLSAFPGAAFKMPYWWHNGIEAVPTEAFINRQLAAHIRAEFKNCISNFEPFAGRFEVNELDEPVVDVQFNDNDVSATLKYPLEIISKDGNLKTVIEKFSYIVPIRFKKVYELARLVMERENKDYFLEMRTIDLYSMDSDIPTTDVEARCKIKVWKLSDIKEKLAKLLRVNLPYIRVKGTDYNPNIYVPNPGGKSIYSQTYFQQHYIWEINKEPSKYKNMKVSFAYENWPLEIYARPSENGILRSNSQKGSDMLSFFCLHIWHFTYDISYPVAVTILDQETGKNRPYRFSFAFKVSIDHNQPSRINKGTTLFEEAPDLLPEDFCNSLQNEITIFTVNNATGEDIRGVNLTFACGRHDCYMGQSDWLSLGAAAGISKKFPYCTNGVIKGSTEGFAESKSFIQTNVDGKSYVLVLNPIKEFRNYKVVKHLLSEPGTAQELNSNEKASILIKGKDTGFEGFAVYPAEAEFPLKLPDSRDATYEVTIYLVDEENIIGGYIGEWKAGKDDLRKADEIVFHAIEQGPASDDEKLLFISGLNSYSKKIPAPELR